MPAEMDLSGLLIALALVAVAWLLFLLVLWLHRPTRDQVGPLVRLIPDLGRMAHGVLRDPATPRSVKVAIGFLLVWLASPIDLIPDFLPVVGVLDDVLVAAIVLRWAARRVGAESLRSHWTGSPEGWQLIERLL